MQRLPWRRKPGPELLAQSGPTCGQCRYLHQSPAELEGRKPNGTDFDLPCTRFGQQEGFRACDAFERRLKTVPPIPRVVPAAL